MQDVIAHVREWQTRHNVTDAQMAAALHMSVWTYRTLRSRPRSSLGDGVVTLLGVVAQHDLLPALLESTE